VAALLLAHGNALNPDDIRAAIETTAQNIGGQELGAGLVDAFAALQWTAGPTPNKAPIAIAGADQTLSDSDGNGTELVTLDGSGSYDPDGSIVSYEWQTDNTTIATSSITSTVESVGTHIYTLTVTDNEGLQASSSVSVTIVANQAPTANAGANQSAFVDTEVSFDASGSSDDGSIVSYDWDFGDGITGSGANPAHTYVSEGVFTVTLTVTDNTNLTDTDTATITNSVAPAISLSTTGYKVKGKQKADLQWSGVTSSQVDIYRNNTLVANTLNDGLYTDNINQKGGGAYTYKVCEENTPLVCSNESIVTF